MYHHMTVLTCNYITSILFRLVLTDCMNTRVILAWSLSSLDDPWEPDLSNASWLYAVNNYNNFIAVLFFSSNLPNRSTFTCPICHFENLDCSDLIKHCNEKHRHESGSFVSPCVQLKTLLYVHVCVLLHSRISNLCGLSIFNWFKRT